MIGNDRELYDLLLQTARALFLSTKNDRFCALVSYNAFFCMENRKIWKIWKQLNNSFFFCSFSVLMHWWLHMTLKNRRFMTLTYVIVWHGNLVFQFIYFFFKKKNLKWKSNKKKTNSKINRCADACVRDDRVDARHLAELSGLIFFCNEMMKITKKIKTKSL